MKTQDNASKEIVAIFDSDENLQAVIDALGLIHFSRQDVSIIKDKDEIRKKILNTSKSSRKPFSSAAISKGINITPEERGVGTGVILGGGLVTGVASALLVVGELTELAIVIPTVLVGSVTGLIFGGAMIKVVGIINSTRLKKRIDNEGLILWVRVDSTEKEVAAKKVFKAHKAKNIRTYVSKIS
ncbi:MAG: hypothetical protein EOP33_02225 [Rickettsiaceae bacterium]|nr:MAG: hypothetical protein EOP33_02225 [Rickettsiaceae bacterium]